MAGNFIPAGNLMQYCNHPLGGMPFFVSKVDGFSRCCPEFLKSQSSSQNCYRNPIGVGQMIEDRPEIDLRDRFSAILNFQRLFCPSATLSPEMR
jgi:hypothetical protein